MYQIHGQLACNPALYSGHRTQDIISYQYIPAETKFTFASGETARVNWTLHLRYHTTPPCSANTDVLEQGTVPILHGISQMRNLYMTIEHTPQCDKITRKAFGMNRQAVPVSVQDMHSSISLELQE